MMSISTLYYWGDKVKKDEVGGVCSTYGREEQRCVKCVCLC
jgi:hypothetical protein